MAMTIAEKILAKKSGRGHVAAGDLVTVEVDTVVLFDNNFMPSIWQDVLKMEHSERGRAPHGAQVRREIRHRALSRRRWHAGHLPSGRRRRGLCAARHRAR